MSKRTLSLIAGVAGLVMLLGGIALGNTLRDDGPDAAASPDTVAIAAATPADPDSGADGPTEPFWPEPSAHQVPVDRVRFVEPGSTTGIDGSGGDRDGSAVAPTAGPSGSPSPDASISLVGLADPADAGTDPADGEPGDFYRPPTVPGGLNADGVGEPDPDAPPVVADGVVEVDLEELLLGGSGDDDADGPPGSDAPAPLDTLPFRDPCAERDRPGADDGDAEADPDSDDPCPEGIGGTIILPTGGGDPPAPLHIMRQFYVSINVPLELRCPDLGLDDDDVYRPLFGSNNPAEFTIRYWPSRDPSRERTTTYRSSDAEMELWIDRRLAGVSTSSDLHSGVHNCPVFEGLEAGTHMTFEVHGVDDLGSEATVTIYATVPARRSTPRTRPPASFTPMPFDIESGILAVPYDPTTESVYMAAIARSGPRASEASCTEIEGAMLDGRHRADPALQETGITLLSRAPGAPAHDPRFSQVVVARLRGDEGTRYQLCVWAARPRARSFDRPTVVYRDSFLVRAPRALRVRVSVGGGHADQPLAARSVWVTATNWPTGERGTFPATDVPARAFMLEGPVLLFDSDGIRVPNTSILEVRGPEGTTTLVEVPTRTRCAEISLFGCPSRGVSQYDVQIPGRVVGRGLCGSGFGGSCDPPSEQTYVGNLRILVERYAGPGGPPTGGAADGWQVIPRGSFAPADAAERPATPQIDSLNSSLRATGPGPTGRPGLAMRLAFDRPVRIEATPFNNFEQPCVVPEPLISTNYQQVVSFTWRELCFGGTYSIALLAVDEDGNELDLRPIVDGERTPWVGWGYLELPGFPIAEFGLDIKIDRLGDGIRPQSLNVNVGGVSVGNLIAAGHPPRCRTAAVPSSTFTPTIRSNGGRPIQWGDSVMLYLTVAGTGDGYGCGLDERFVRVELVHQLWLDELLAGPVTLTYDEADAEITVSIRNVTRR